MGTWGTALFADDTSSDVRDAYLRLVASGLTGPEATEQLRKEWKALLADEDEGPVFWLALAATQWQCGRLEARVKARALKIIANGSSLGRWSEQADAQALLRRKAVLEKLDARLRSPQPRPQTFRKPRQQESSWFAGEVLAYRLRSGRIVLLHLVNPGRGSLGGKPPIFTVLDWIGKSPPDTAEIKQLSLKCYAGSADPIEFMTVGRLLKAQAERLVALGVRRKPHRKVTGGFPAFLWKELDRHLKELLGWK
jgi:hypothetical protein